MAEKEIPEPLRKIRNKWPVARCNKTEWKKIQDLAMSGDSEKEKEAERLAKECTLNNPRLRARHAGAKIARKRRREFLKHQASVEKEIRKELVSAWKRMNTVILAAGNDEGTINPGRYPSLIAKIQKINTKAYSRINRKFKSLIRKSVRMGLKKASEVAQAVVQQAKQIQEADGDVDPFRQDLEIGGTVFQKLFVGTLRKTMKAGLFGGTGVSNRVWDLRNDNLEKLKRLVSGGLARGDSPQKISRSIRGLLVQPKTLRGFARADARPGRGVYRSAYKNALRLTRNESNRAFARSDSEFAKKKKWNVMWMVSVGQREFDECDALNGQVMTPEEFDQQFPQHPQCLCFSTLVAPDVG